jgi:eukaryotic translation initiation factor 2C
MCTDIKAAAIVGVQKLADFFSGRLKEVPQDYLNAMEVILSQRALERLSPRARSFYSPQTAEPLGGGLQMWRGFFQSVRPVQSGLVLNIDVCATTYHEPKPVLELAAELWRCQGLDDLRRVRVDGRNLAALKKAMKNVRVELTHRADQKRRYRIVDVGRSAREIT